MKKFFLVFVCIAMILSGCINHTDAPNSSNVLKIGDTFSITGVVDYSDEPSDIGQEYCSITGNTKIEYYYTDIYDKESKWSSNVFYTKEDDTLLLKEYIGTEITISGVFDAESHGIPYITNITIMK